MTTKPPPDFDLAPLQGFAPATLDMTNPMARFILVLAGVFNDLKGAWYLVERVRAAAPVVEPNLAWKGQLSGMRSHLLRTIAGILHELMNFISEHEAIVESPDFVNLTSRLAPPAREAWEEVVRVAVGDHGGQTAATSEAKLLLMIRNNLAFHYGDKVLAKGYGEFFKDTSIPLHDRSVVSLGNTMEETRFYFADAAVEQALSERTGLTARELEARLSAVAGRVNHALRFLVGGYVHHVATLAPYA